MRAYHAGNSLPSPFQKPFGQRRRPDTVEVNTVGNIVPVGIGTLGGPRNAESLQPQILHEPAHRGLNSAGTCSRPIALQTGSSFGTQYFVIKVAILRGHGPGRITLHIAEALLNEMAPQSRIRDKSRQPRSNCRNIQRINLQCPLPRHFAGARYRRSGPDAPRPAFENRQPEAFISRNETYGVA